MSHLEVVVTALRTEASTVTSYELKSLDGTALPPFTAGSHVDVLMESGLTRSYSLLNSPEESHRYVMGVHLDAASKGGSLFMHTRVGLGTKLKISEPRNNFPLDEGAENTVLIAGGIGITPMMSMAHRLRSRSMPFTLHYAGRQRSHMAFVDKLSKADPHGDVVRLHVDEESEGRHLDLQAIVNGAPPDTHFYCCGPGGMLQAFTQATSELPPDHVHLERFSSETPSATEGGFVVQLKQTGKEVAIAPGATILDTLLQEGVPVSYSCMQGVCGNCEVRVLAGEPDHRDSVLTNNERKANDRMMICCSGSKSGTLVLDL